MSKLEMEPAIGENLTTFSEFMEEYYLVARFDMPVTRQTQKPHVFAHTRLILFLLR